MKLKSAFQDLYPAIAFETRCAFKDADVICYYTMQPLTFTSICIATIISLYIKTQNRMRFETTASCSPNNCLGLHFRIAALRFIISWIDVDKGLPIFNQRPHLLI